MAGVNDFAETVQVRAPVRIDHALRAPGGPGGVVDRDRGKLVGDRPGQRLLCAPGQELGVAHQPRLAAQIRIRRRKLGVLGDHQLGHRLHVLGGRHCRRKERRVDNHDLRARVTEDVCHLVGREPGVYRDEHRAGQRDRVMRDEHLRQVRHQVRDPVARPDTARPQRSCHPLRLGRQLAVGEPPRAVDHSGLAGPYSRRPFQERQRRHCRIRNRIHTDPPRDVLIACLTPAPRLDLPADGHPRLADRGEGPQPSQENGPGRLGGPDGSLGGCGLRCC